MRKIYEETFFAESYLTLFKISKFYSVYFLCYGLTMLMTVIKAI